MTRALVVVAHPDDETIWCGGTILRMKDTDFTIISLCRKHDRDRATKFFRACRLYRAKCAMSDLEDDHPEQRLDDLREVKERIRKMLSQRKFDMIFTHGDNGEYGHNRHKEVHDAVVDMIREGELECRKLMFFDYRKEGTECMPNEDADQITELGTQELQAKKQIISEVYEFEEGSFEESSSRPTESFMVGDTA